jgi:hypothetical protein
MDHLDAEQIKAVERYVLNDLSVSEVEEFERHFFDCPQCSEELRALTIFQENARAVFAGEDPAPVPAMVTAPKSAAKWWQGFSPQWSSSRMASWAPAFAALLIGLFAGWASFHPREDVQALYAHALYAQARGEETVVSPPAGAESFELYLDKTWDGEYASYTAVLDDASGAEKFTLPLNAGAAGDAMRVLVKGHRLTPGKYVLVMRGNNSGKETELARFPFTLRFQ